MKVLNIYTTYSCPYKCKFCFNLNKCNDTTQIDLDYVDDFLKKHAKLFDKIVITGGEPSFLVKSYINELIEIIKKYHENIEFSTYNTNDIIYDNVSYNISYDFVIRPKADVMWKKLLDFNRPFTLTTTLSPLIFRIPPNKIIMTLNLLKYLRKFVIIPFYQSESIRYNILNNDYKRFLSYIELFKKDAKYQIEYNPMPDEYNLTPYNKLTITQFDNNGIRFEKEIKPTEIKKETTNYPKNIII